MTYSMEREFLKLLLLKVYGSFLFRQTKKMCGIFWSVWVFFAFLRVRRLSKYCLWEENLVFYICIYLVWCDKLRIYREKQHFKILFVLWPIFVADMKIFFGYNFVAPLTNFEFTRLLTAHDLKQIRF